MRLLVNPACVVAVGLFPIAGCNQVVDEPETAPLEFAVVEVSTPGAEGVLLEGVEVCELDTTECKLSDARGRVSIELPVGVETAVALTKEGYWSQLVPVVLGESGSRSVYGIESDELAADQFDRVMTLYPTGLKGSILFGIFPALAGATFDLVDAAGSAAFYSDDEGWWSPDLEATTSWGWGGVAEVNPGVFEAKLGGAAQGCVRLRGWPGDDANSIRFSVREGRVTWIAWSCQPSP